MLNGLIRLALRQRLFVAAIAMALILFGGWKISQLPIDVFPNLNRPRVTILTEAHGMAPEEVESLITIPLEAGLNGAAGVQAVRSASSPGMSVVYVEFDWDTDIYNDRQIVNERIALANEQLPEGITPQLAPISSIMGQIVLVGMWSKTGETSPMEVRTYADWVVRQQLLTIEGVSQVFVMGGGRKQFQVLVDPGALTRYGVSLDEVKTALKESNQNSTGGYLDDQGTNEILVRSVGRIESIDELKEVVITSREGRPLLLEQVARIIEGPQVKRGDSSAFIKNDQGQFEGGPAVVLTINKQPDADTRQVSNDIAALLEQLRSTLPEDVHIQGDLYQQKTFIDLAIENVVEALSVGGVLVVIILFIFLMNFRTTFITLTAIPLSIVVTGLVFWFFDLSINTMTLGGLAVAIGELVDDAIVDVENIYRRLQVNQRLAKPKPTLLVVFQASVEVRNSIVFGTLIVILVFIPLFALSGVEGRLFTPMGIAYIVSIFSSLLVSMTVTPVLSYWLLGRSNQSHREKDGIVLRVLKTAAGWAIRTSIKAPLPILTVATLIVAFCISILVGLENDFLPPFNEGAVQINVLLPAGTSLKQSNKVNDVVEQRLLKIEDLVSIVRKTGRAELDEHAEGVNVTEYITSFDPHSQRSRAKVLEDIRHTLSDVPGVVISVEQPLSHLISHMLSGVKAQVGIKLSGSDLDMLRRKADEMKRAIEGIEGVKDLQIEQQTEIQQLRIDIDGHRLKYYGLRASTVNELIETAMNGEVVSEILLNQRTFDLIVRLDEPYREDIEAVKRLTVHLPGGGSTTLDSIAHIHLSSGPNTIKREQVRRRIVLQCNTAGRGLVDVVQEIKAKIKPIEDDLPIGYRIEYGGQFESQQSASRVISILFAFSLLGMFLVLFSMFRSVNLSLQVMIALPMAFIGSVAAIVITGQTLSIASMVGFISLCGIATRNGILLINHYLHLVKYEGESLSREMIVRAGQERLAPVLMTALTSGIGLAPLAFAAGQPGKEILYPVATVIIGGLISSTVLEFFVRPALFWKFGLRAAQAVVKASDEEVELFTMDEKHRNETKGLPVEQAN